MKKKAKRTLTPKLRFPEFRDKPAWGQVRLDKLAARITSKNSDGNTTRVLTNSAEHGVLDQRNYFEKDIANAGNIGGYYVIDQGDYVYNPRISNIAPVGPISRNNVGKGVMSPLYTMFRFFDEYTDFYELFFKTTCWHPYIRKVASMGARHDRMSITTGDFMAMPVPTPTPAEQRKIADCLSSLDELIAAEGRKLEALRVHKQGLMQQLFPRPGETRPRLRFPEFRNKPQWEDTSLGQVVDFQSGGTPSKNNPAFWNGAIPWVSAKDMKQLFLDDTKDYITAAAFDSGAKQVPAGTVLILTRGMTLLKDIPICFLRCSMSFNQDVRALRSKGDLLGDFLPYLLLAAKQRLLDMVDVAGHGTGRLDTEKLKTLVVQLPRPSEQRRIVAALSCIEHLIPSQDQKLATLRIHKKGLMQQLFPSTEGAEA